MTPEQWDRLWNAGIPLVLLTIGIIKLWVTWRIDVKNASDERILNRASIDALTKSVNEQNEKLNSFFLTHFP